MDLCVMVSVLVVMVMTLGYTLGHENVPPIQMHQAPGVPPSHNHQHETPQAKALHDQANIQDRDHVMEHYDGVIDPTAKLSDQELNFHYFKVHDYDKNNQLDGIELIAALTHYHKDDNPDAPRLSDTELGEMIDTILSEDDADNNGFIDYAEFIMSQQKGQANP